MGMQLIRKHQARAFATAVEEMNPLLPAEHPERLGRVVRGLASDLVAERRRSNALQREVRELRAELATARRAPS
ncbi:MAG: hypothetical protein ACJ77Z_05415 [Thermoleophilaceae bacterium]